MKTRVLLFLLFVATLIAGGTLVTVLFNTAPTTTEIILLFYCALTVVIFGLVFFTIYSLAALRFQGLPDWQSTVSALRIGVIAGIFSAVLLAIQSVSFLNLATFVIVLILALACELMLRRRLVVGKR